MHDLKVRKYDADKLLRNDFFFFHEVSRFDGGGGQGLSSLPLSSVGDICRPFVIPISCQSSLDSLLVTEGNSRGNRNRFHLCCTITRIVLFSRIRFYSLRGETLGFHELRASRMDISRRCSRSFTRLEVMTFRVRRATFA